MEESGVHAVMVGRGALIRPWIFQEFKEVCVIYTLYTVCVCVRL